jgi:hypothetical protein
MVFMRKYWPLFALILVAALGAVALQKGNWMHYFMGLFLCQFAMLKLFHPAGFADGFQMYDLIAKKFRVYAYLYPVIELALGLAYLSFSAPTLTYIVTIVVMGIGAVGVIKALREGLDVRCACMGTVLDVPLSTVTLTEDIGMIAMAFWMLI